MERIEDWEKDGYYQKIFVAGIPSGIHPQRLIHFFSSCSPYTQNGSKDHIVLDRNASHKLKGHCILVCFNRDLVKWILDQKYHNFVGRTLTVTPFRTGSKIIVQNKRLNKSRVIFKKVPNIISEEDFKIEIESQLGKLIALFQFKTVNPLNMQKRQSSIAKFFTYSAIFEDRAVADKAIEAKFILLSDEIGRASCRERVLMPV